MTTVEKITVGELIARCLEMQNVKAAYGVISIHNMPILDAFNSRKKIRFIPARGEAGACNMADAHARVSRTLGVVITSTGTGAGNAAGALIEAFTAGTPMLHLTGQIDSPFLDKNLGFIHEAPAQLAMLKAVGKDAFRISSADHALSVIEQAIELAMTPPCGPVSIEIPIDVQASLLEIPKTLSRVSVIPKAPSEGEITKLAGQLSKAKRPLLWLGGGARHCKVEVERFIALGWGVVTSVQGRGVIAEDHSANLGAFNLQKPVEDFYATCDALLVVGSKLRSNETLSYKLILPSPLYRIDADTAANQRAYPNATFVQGDASLSLKALADQLVAAKARGEHKIDPRLHGDLAAARLAAEKIVDDGLGAYVHLKNTLNTLVKKTLGGQCHWVRDITLSNTMWGNRSLLLNQPTSGVHALGGGIGQGLPMGIGAAIASDEHQLNRKTITLIGDGGFMLNPGELACAVQEKADLLMIVMNDGGYGVIKNIQDAVYGSRHCYVDLHNPNFAMFCQSLGVLHFSLQKPEEADSVLSKALAAKGPVMVEVDMKSWGPFVAKFAGPPKKH
jgi:acetolactate synthase I/II/III large subunit